jgi:predicted ATPase
MSDMTIKELLSALKNDFANDEFDKFIHDATFPNFKKIKPFAKIEFKFPLTVLVGVNGGGKSSILHAMWGMPSNYSTSRFWFATKIDPISIVADSKPNVPRYWYTHYIKKLQQKVQSRKVFPKKTERSWEPSRPAADDGMNKMPDVTHLNRPFTSKSGDRWTAVERETVYINTKSESSAFDRFFYHTELTKLTDRQDFFIKRSAKLHAAMEGDKSVVNIGRGVFEVQKVNISAAHLKTINRILGKKYIAAKKVVHDLFDRNKSPSVIFKTEAHTYSESFAGSGELAVVNLVLRVEELADYGLLLIDEPETSLHPGAQSELIRYLLDKAKAKKIQIVIATHSPTIVNLLPEHALIVLDETPDGTTVNVKATKSAAFYRLGQPNPNKVTIITEDKLLQAYVERAVSLLPNDLQSRIEVKAAVTGASEMLSHQVPAYMNMPNVRVLMVLDGDQKKFLDLVSVDPQSLSPNAEEKFITDIAKECNVTIVGSNPDVSEYIKWCMKNIITIDQVCPEVYFMQLLSSDLVASTLTNQKCKSMLRKLLKERGDAADSNSQYTIFKSKLGDAISSDSNGASAVVSGLKDFAGKLKNMVSN